MLEGYGKIIDPGTVEIALNDGGSKRLTTRAIVIASGAEPVVPPIPGNTDLNSTYISASPPSPPFQMNSTPSIDPAIPIN